MTCPSVRMLKRIFGQTTSAAKLTCCFASLFVAGRHNLLGTGLFTNVITISLYYCIG